LIHFFLSTDNFSKLLKDNRVTKNACILDSQKIVLKSIIVCMWEVFFIFLLLSEFSFSFFLRKLDPSLSHFNKKIFYRQDSSFEFLWMVCLILIWISKKFFSLYNNNLMGLILSEEFYAFLIFLSRRVFSWKFLNSLFLFALIIFSKNLE